jgi:hypothetical protein
MKVRVPRPVWAAPALVALLAVAAAAGPFRRGVETVYVEPTSSILALPTSDTYVLPTAYTSYIPTVYATSYAWPSYYVSTSSYVPTYYYQSARYVPRRRYAYDVVPTTYYYYPSTYYPTSYTYAYPTLTSLDTSILTTSATTTLCQEAPPVALPPAPTAPVQSGGATTGGSTVVPSTPRGEPGLDPNAAKPRGNQNQAPAGGGNNTNAGGAGGATDEIERPTKPATDDVPSPPEVSPPPAGANDAQRKAMRPAFNNNSLNLKPQAQSRSLLQGRVVSGANGDPQANVEVTFINQGGRFANRSVTSNDQGRFEVKMLPDGDWKIEVADANGKGQPFEGLLTVSGGRVTDENGRLWTSLTLNR